MNVKNCRRCGKIFNYVAGPFICPTCREAAEAEFQKVKNYIRDNKGVGIREVAEACEVEVSQIQQWLREERLELSTESGIMLSCESCGCSITSGRYCDKCKNAMARGLSNAAGLNRPQAPATPAKPEKEGDKMRFLRK